MNESEHPESQAPLLQNAATEQKISGNLSSLDDLFENIHKEAYSEAREIISIKSFSDWEQAILITFWDFIFLESTREELGDVMRRAKILTNNIYENMSLERRIEIATEAAERHNLGYTQELLRNLEEMYREGLTQSISSDGIHQIEMQKYEIPATSKHTYSRQESDKTNNYSNILQLFIKAESSGVEMGGGILSDIIEQMILFQSGDSMEAVRKTVKGNHKLKNKLPAFFLTKILENKFEFLLQYKHVLRYIIDDHLGIKTSNKALLNTEKNSNDLINELINSLTKRGYLEIKFHLLRIVEPNFEYEQDKDLINRISKLFKNEKSVQNIIFNCLNPIKIVILGLELVKTIRSHTSGHDFLCDEVEEILLEFAVNLLDSIDNIHLLNEILLDKDIEGRKTIIIIVNQEDKRLLRNPLLQSIAENMWFQSVGTSKHLGFISTLYLVITQRKLVFNYLGYSPIVQPKLYSFSRRNWKQSPMAKFTSKSQIEIMFIVGIAIIFGICPRMFEFVKMEKEELSTALNWLILCQAIVFIHYYTVIQFVLNIVIANRLNLPILYSPVDLCSEIFKVSYLTLTSAIYFHTPNKEADWMDNEGFYYMVCLGGLVFVLLFMNIAKIRYIKSFGFIILSLSSMTMEIVKYMTIYFMQLFAFIVILSIIFFKSLAYANLLATFIMLFDNSLGIPPHPLDNSIYAFGSRSHPYHDTMFQLIIGRTIIALFYICNIIIVANLIIAVLNDSYEKAKENKNILYVQGILTVHLQLEISSQYSSIKYTAFPLNVLLLPLTLALMLTSKLYRKRLNHLILDIGYIVYFLLIFIMFIITEIFLLPIAYIFETLYLLAEFVEKPKITDTVREHKIIQIFKIIIKICIWILFGVLILIYYIYIQIINVHSAVSDSHTMRTNNGGWFFA